MNKEKVEIFQYVWLWDKGEMQTENQDAVYIRSFLTKCGQCLIFCICDGMGGPGNGKEASAYTVERIDEWVDTFLIPMLEKVCFCKYFRSGYSLRCFRFKQIKMLRNAGYMLFSEMNQHLFRRGRKNGGFGTTMSMCILFGGRYFIFHVGDSAVYRVRSGKRMTKRHSCRDNVLERCLGMNRDDKVDFSFGKCSRKDAFLVGSDGLFKRMEVKKIKAVFSWKKKKEEGPAYFRKRLEEIAAHNRRMGETDNISAVYVWR